MKRCARVALAVLILVQVASIEAGAQDRPPLRSMVFPKDSARSRNPTSNQRSIVDSATAILSRLEIHESILKPGANSHAPHRHGHEEVIYIQQGDVKVFQGDVVRTAHAGDVVFLASNEWHNFTNIGATDAKYLVVRIDTRDQPKDLPSASPPTVPSLP